MKYKTYNLRRISGYRLKINAAKLPVDVRPKLIPELGCLITLINILRPKDLTKPLITTYARYVEVMLAHELTTKRKIKDFKFTVATVDTVLDVVAIKLNPEYLYLTTFPDFNNSLQPEWISRGHLEVSADTLPNTCNVGTIHDVLLTSIHLIQHPTTAHNLALIALRKASTSNIGLAMECLMELGIVTTIKRKPKDSVSKQCPRYNPELDLYPAIDHGYMYPAFDESIAIIYTNSQSAKYWINSSNFKTNREYNILLAYLDRNTPRSSSEDRKETLTALLALTTPYLKYVN